jgi:YidC/Oxa1 family membrane protein insertase
MDRKSLIVLVAAVLLLLGLSPVVDHFFPPKPVPVEAQTATNQEPTNVTGQTTGAKSAISVASTTPVVPSQPEKTLTLANDSAVFQFTSDGGGLKTVSLKNYPAIISRTEAIDIATNMVTLNGRAPVPVFSVVGNGVEGDNYFTLTQRGQTVIAEKTLTNGLRLVKEFDLSSNYLFTAKLRLENTSGQSINLPAREVVVGTATAIAPLDDPTALGTYWYNGIKAQNINQNWFANHLLSCAILPGTPRTVYQDGADNVVWAAVHNQFFTLAAIPSNAAPEVVIRPIYVPTPALVGVTNRTSAFLTNGFETAFAYPAAVLPAHQTLERDFTFYAGPKKYDMLADIGDKMNNKLDLVMDFNGYTGFFSKGLLTAMNFFYNNLHLAYGWTIIIITLVIKGIFWPLTRASTRSQKRMQALQPEMKKIADKYKDDPVKKNEATMEFMKRHKISPLGSCLPTVIQIPVFFGFYYMLRNAIELRGVHFLWAHDLSQADTVAIIAGLPINPLPILMGATQLWQAQMLPASQGMDPDQQKIMKYMPLLFVAMFYKMSAGLTLYWTVSNLLSVFQTRVTKLVDADAAPAGAVAKKKR